MNAFFAHRLQLEQLGLLPSVFQQRANWERIARIEDHFQILGFLGAGFSGTALLVKQRLPPTMQSGGETLVLKIYTNTGQQRSDEAEIDALAALSRVSASNYNPNIVQVRTVFVFAPQRISDIPIVLAEQGFGVGEDYTVAVLEHIGGQELFDAIVEYWSEQEAREQQSRVLQPRTNFAAVRPFTSLIEQLPTPLPPTHVRKIMKELLGALTFLHALGFAHRDIKPQNMRFRLSGTNEIVVLDFGFACNQQFDNESDHALSCKNRPSAGTMEYVSPEFMRSAAIQELPSAAQAMAGDVWSLAQTIAFLVVGKKPHESTDAGEELVNSLLEYRQPPKIIYALDRKVNELLRQMLDADWQTRITAISAFYELTHGDDSIVAYSEDEVAAALRDPTHQSDVVPHIYLQKGVVTFGAENRVQNPLFAAQGNPLFAQQGALLFDEESLYP